jgi:hypothetical protein
MCMDPASVKPLENMTELKHLNEAAILYNLKLRFQQKSPYTVIGAPGIAADPSALAEQNAAAAGLGRQGSLAPVGVASCFADSTIVLLNTFREPEANVRMYIRRVCYNMLSSMVATRRHQAVLFAGESGSGKTHFSREFVYRLVMVRALRAWRRVCVCLISLSACMSDKSVSDKSAGLISLFVCLTSWCV